MRQSEFKKMLEKTSGYELFMIKAQAYQEQKNLKRKAKERWNEGKVERATYRMWDQIIENMYEQLDDKVDYNKYNRETKWNEFIEKYEIIENFNQNISEMEFE